MIAVCCEVHEYPEDGTPSRTLTVKSHWHWNDRVVLSIPEVRTPFVVRARDLITAIENATRNAR